MICPPCADAADSIARAVRDGDIEPAGHHPDICRDRAIQPGGCPCGHRPVGVEKLHGRGNDGTADTYQPKGRAE